jgi:hypothetical protein
MDSADELMIGMRIQNNHENTKQQQQGSTNFLK